MTLCELNRQRQALNDARVALRNRIFTLAHAGQSAELLDCLKEEKGLSLALVALEAQLRLLILSKIERSHHALHCY